MNGKNHTMENATAIVYTYATEQYYVNYRWEETSEYNVALPVYTGNMAANGTMNKSRNLRTPHTASRTTAKSENVDVTERAAKAMIRAFDNAGRLGSLERLDGAVIIQNVNAPTKKRVVAIGDNTGITAVSPDFGDMPADFDEIMQGLEEWDAAQAEHQHSIGIY